MLKALRYVFLAILAIALLAVASANRDPVTLRVLPTEIDRFLGYGWSIELPLFVVIFAGILGGLGIGLVWEWFREARIRAEGSMHKQRATHLEREVNRLQGAKGETKDEILALLDGNGARG
jgi:uncharacterized integral membrane protein